MIALDTNVLVRLLVNDPEESLQINAAKAILRTEKQVYCPQIVQVETVWVLQSAYKFEKNAIISVLEHIKSHPFFILQHQEVFALALENYCKNNADFSDCLILEESQDKACKLATFDKKLGKLQGVHQIVM